jgi:hypothetical protein
MANFAIGLRDALDSGNRPDGTALTAAQVSAGNAELERVAGLLKRQVELRGRHDAKEGLTHRPRSAEEMWQVSLGRFDQGLRLMENFLDSYRAVVSLLFPFVAPSGRRRSPCCSPLTRLFRMVFPR